jgi:hypothetical protein
MADQWLCYNSVRLQLTEDPRTRRFPGGLILLGGTGEFLCDTQPTCSSLQHLRNLLLAPGKELTLGRQSQPLLQVPAGSSRPRWIDVQSILGRQALAVLFEMEFTLPTQTVNKRLCEKGDWLPVFEVPVPLDPESLNQESCSRSAFASCRSGVSNPSVNQS